jgi:hypothetical protein
MMGIASVVLGDVLIRLHWQRAACLDAVVMVALVSLRIMVAVRRRSWY